MVQWRYDVDRFKFYIITVSLIERATLKLRSLPHHWATTTTTAAAAATAATAAAVTAAAIRIVCTLATATAVATSLV